MGACEAIGFYPIDRKFSNTENPIGESTLQTPSDPIPMTPEPKAHPDSVTVASPITSPRRKRRSSMSG
jgi:hypothetical protein